MNGHSKIESPKQIINFVPILSEIPPVEALSDAPSETERPDCSCVKMLFALISQIPKKEKVALVTKGTLMDSRQLIP